MKKSVLAGLILMIPVIAVAQNTPQWEIFGGYSYTRFDTGNAQDEINLFSQELGLPAVNIGKRLNMNGWSASLQENTNNWFGGVLDFSGNYIGKNNALFQGPGFNLTLRTSVRMYTFMAGPQFTLRMSSRLQPFVRVLAGGAHLSVRATALNNGAAAAPPSTGTDLGFAMGGGGGVDFHVLPHVAVRAAGDYIRTSLGSEAQQHLRLSGGLVFRIGSR